MKQSQNHISFLTEATDISFAEHVRRLGLKNTARGQFILLSSAALLSACGGGGGGGGGSSAIRVDPMMANTGTARGDVFAIDAGNELDPTPPAGFSLNGGAGLDELRGASEGDNFSPNADFSPYNGVINSIEIINTAGGDDVNISITASDVMAFSDLSTREVLSVNNLELLILQGDISESVTLDAGWTLLSGSNSNGILTYQGEDYNLFQNGNALLAIEEGRPVTSGGTTLANSAISRVMNDNNLIFGTSRSETLRGGSGDDFIYGGDGDDILISGDGSDVLVGGSGRDTFYFNGDPQVADTASKDMVLDFERDIDRFALFSRADLEEIVQDANPSATASQVSQATSRFITENTPASFLQEFLEQGIYVASIVTENIFGSTDSVNALQFTTTAGSYRLGAVVNGSRVEVNETFLNYEVTIIPTEEVPNFIALDTAITAGNTDNIFNEIINALGGADNLIYI